MHQSPRKKIAVVVAGGVGMRMGADRPKQFLALEGRSILTRTLETFLSSYPDLELILVLPADHMDSGMAIAQGLAGSERIRFVIGGETRFHSVQNGLSVIEDSSVVLVHDAVRCLLSIDLIHRCYDQALRQGSAIPAIASKDSVRWVIDGKSKSIPRNEIRLIQTPQTFLSEVLLPAYKVQHHADFTDEASVVEASGQSVYLIEGEDRNIKITHPDDLITAAQWLRSDQ